MKRLLALAALLLLAGCHRARVAPAAAVGVSVPGKCVLGAIVNPVKCKAITNDAVVCDGMVVKLACVESAKP